MSQTVTVRFDKPIISAEVLDGFADAVESKLSGSGPAGSGANNEKVLIQDLEAQKAAFLQACQTLNGVIARLNQFL